MTTFKTTNVSERCDALSTARASSVGIMQQLSTVCSVSLYWDPTMWFDLYTGNVLETTSLLPVAGYYCAEVCATFPTPIGYRMQDCRFMDIDECAVALASNIAICAQHTTCTNRKVLHHSLLTETHEGTLSSTGYMCICLPGYFTIQTAPTACESRGLEVLFFMTEIDNTTVHGTTNTNNGTVSVSAAAISVFYTLKTMRRRVISHVQTQVGGMNLTVDAALFAASSTFADNSISFESAGTAKIWKIKIYIASAFVQMRHDTLKNMAAVIRSSVVANPLPHFQLHTQTICSGLADGPATTLQDVCTVNMECAATGKGVCQNAVAYVQVHLVETDSFANNIDSQSAEFVLISVKFNMAARVWFLELQFDDYEDGTRRVLFLSKTRILNDVVIYAGQDDLQCADITTQGQNVENVQEIAECLAGLADRYHMLQSFHDQFLVNGAMTTEQRTRLQSGFLHNEDFATGRFSTLPSATVSEALYVRLNEAAAAAEGSLLVTKTRVVTLTLTYAEALSFVGTNTKDGVGGSEVSVDFFVGMATLRVRDGKMTTSVVKRDILTKIGTNYVLSHDITDESLSDVVVPSIAVSLYNVHSRTLPTSSWGFISYNIRLPPSAIAAGVTFDQRDVIPVDSVIGSIAFFQDDPLDTNAYPCIYRPSVESYTRFTAQVGCSNVIKSVRMCCNLYFIVV